MSRARAGRTPMMEQYHRIKSLHPGRVLLYRMGDFYETFFDDAILASKVLGITLTQRGKSEGEPVPLAGVPHHSLNTYVHRLLRAGHSVAICEQVEDPAQAKGVVERAVTEVITPGTVAIEEFLPADRGSYCLALLPGEDSQGYALGDISTGELLAGQDAPAVVMGLPSRFRVSEVLHAEGAEESDFLREFKTLHPELHYTPRAAWDFLAEEAEATLRKHFGVSRGEQLGFRAGEDAPLRASGALLAYFRELKSADLGYFDHIEILREEETMVLDRVTVENLELMRPLRGDDPGATLFHQINRCQTRMGARMLSRWLLAPLLDRAAISARHDAVGELLAEPGARERYGKLLVRATDLERLVGRLSGTSPRPRDLRALADTLGLMPALREELGAARAELLGALGADVDELPGLRSLLERGLVEEPPVKLSDGGVIAEGFDAELDRLRALTRDGRSWILGLQEKERERTGIAKLKIGYNKVFGYYLEVSKGQSTKVPADYIVKQQLTGSLRYVTPELKSREEEILGAQERLQRREAELFEELRAAAYAEHAALQGNARVLAAVDVLRGLAELAERNRYARPELLEEPVLRIREGRHPVVEALLDGDFIANDVELDTQREQILLLTGPNMGGKSTYLRQTALIVLMAQMGGFVPAASASIGITDKIFTRVGASDNLARGQSTFLIEMEETATILRNLTERSLVVMDEIGRGTSTYDGLSLAWSVLEYLHAAERPHAKTLFATHYHELTRLEDDLTRLVNRHVSVKEWQDEIIFLRRVEPGPAERSYGIHVARLAGLPAAVTERAFQLLQWIEESQKIGVSGPTPSRAQLELFTRDRHPVLEALRELDPDQLTPLEALSLLGRWRAQLDDEK